MQKVLIVDDSAFMRNMIKNIILTTHLPIKIVGEASDGQEAVEKFKQLKPDIVTLDVTINKKNGLEVLEEIMSLNKNTKVIMVSSMGQKTIIMESIKFGARDFVIKPFTNEALLESFNRVVSLK